MSIFDHFQNIKLTKDQNEAVKSLDQFIHSNNDVFVLKGYAGSGKTTLLKGLVSFLSNKELRYQLMAPTGRAAKIINQKTGYKATTIHKGIYSFDELVEIKGDDGNASSYLYQYKISNSKEVHDSILIIDEASMLSNVLSQGEFFRFGSGYLLNDLINYSKVLNPGTTSKLIFIGDPAQLPPIGMSFSPGLDPDYIDSNFNLKTIECELKEVVRQDSTNGILKRASKIRKSLTSGYFNEFDLSPDNVNVYNINYDEFFNTFSSLRQSSIVITYKNKTALGLNLRIRNHKYKRDLPIQASDKVIIGGNNYKLQIMNGEFAIVAEAADTTEERDISFRLKGGQSCIVKLVWRQVSLLMPEENGQTKSVSGMMLENYLEGDNYLSSEEQRALYIDFKNRNPKLKPKTEEFKQAILNDEYFNCILLKYGYAVTCHKAQGGEWNNAFVFWDRGVTKEFNHFGSKQEKIGKTNSDFYRWAYTAITRASDKLFCINPPKFSPFSEMTFVNSEVQNAYEELVGETVKRDPIEMSDELQSVLLEFGLIDQHNKIQDHFISVFTNLKNYGIDTISWERIGYEIRYVFEKSENTAAVKFWVNGKNEFRDSYQQIPSGTNSQDFFNQIVELLPLISHCEVLRSADKSSIDQIEFDTDLEEKKPFLKSLFEVIQCNLSNSEISISKIDHMEYKERYTLVRREKGYTIDFEYNGKGFFGRVVPLLNRCEGTHTIRVVENIVKELKDCCHG